MKAKCFSISLLVFDRVLCSLCCQRERERAACVVAALASRASINRPNNCVEFQIHLTSLHSQSASWCIRSLATCTWPQVSLRAVCVFAVSASSLGPLEDRERQVSLSCACVAETLNNLNARINAARRLVVFVVGIDNCIAISIWISIRIWISIKKQRNRILRRFDRRFAYVKCTKKWRQVKNKCKKNLQIQEIPFLSRIRRRRRLFSPTVCVLCLSPFAPPPTLHCAFSLRRVFILFSSRSSSSSLRRLRRVLRLFRRAAKKM